MLMHRVWPSKRGASSEQGLLHTACKLSENRKRIYFTPNSKTYIRHVADAIMFAEALPPIKNLLPIMQAAEWSVSYLAATVNDSAAPLPATSQHVPRIAFYSCAPGSFVP